MAERKARRRCETEIIKLKAAADCVTVLTVVREGEQRVGPVAAQFYLGRKINALKEVWLSYEASHNHLLDLVTDEEVNNVMETFQVQLAIYGLALGKGEKILDGDFKNLRNETATIKTEDPPDEVPATAEDGVPAAITKAEVPLDEVPATAEDGVPAATTKAEAPPDGVPATAEDGVPAATTKAEVPTDGVPATAEVGVPAATTTAEVPPDEVPATAEDEIPAAATKAGDPPEKVPATAEVEVPAAAAKDEVPGIEVPTLDAATVMAAPGEGGS